MADTDIPDIQKAADKVLEQWTNQCGQAGAYIARELESLSDHADAELPQETAEALVELCELNMRIGIFLNLYALKVSYISDPAVASELFKNYKEIYNAVDKEYFNALKELAKELKTEHGLGDLSDEVTDLYKAIDKLIPPLKKIHDLLKKHAGQAK